MPYLLQLPGFGLIVVMTILTAIGDGSTELAEVITRFPTAKHLVLLPRIYCHPHILRLLAPCQHHQWGVWRAESGQNLTITTKTRQ